jgi:hypothetical protein
MKFSIWVFLENNLIKFNFHLNLTRITGILHVDQYTFMRLSLSFLIRMRNVSDKICTEIENRCFMFNNFSESRVFYETRQENLVESDRTQMTIWRMNIACRIHSATNTPSEYAVIIASPLQQCLHGRASLYVTAHCLSCLRTVWRGTLR